MEQSQENRINELSISHFKSIKELQINPERINVFVGRPNVGKSNILEALSLFSGPFSQDENQYLSEFLRYEDPSQLFYDRNRQKQIQVSIGLGESIIRFINGLKAYNLFIGNKKDLDEFFSNESMDSPKTIKEIKNLFDSIFDEYFNVFHENEITPFLTAFDSKGRISSSEMFLNTYNSPVKKYEFPAKNDFTNSFPDYLLPPHGSNLVTILEQEPELFEEIQPFFEEFGLELLMDNYNYRLEVQKKVGHKVYKIPYSLMADTLQRIIFYLTAIRSNHDSILLLEEPEAHAYPAYVQLLADEIGRDKSNQYFVTTHNPYFLETLLEGEYRNKVGVFLTYYENFETKAKKLSQAEIDNLLSNDADLFFNLKAFQA